eukprot:m.49705 g.49705  ORF g.49705 m.49705 type:complete len:63 (-) comp8973_c0_seq1:72-260(-)
MSHNDHCPIASTHPEIRIQFASSTELNQEDPSQQLTVTPTAQQSSAQTTVSAAWALRRHEYC